MDLLTPDAELRFPTKDIGSFDAPILVCGGAYSNLEALTALLDAASSHAIPHSRIIHTGDAIAYCADPVATADLLRETGIHTIQGNVEESLSASLPDCGCGFDEDTLCDRLAAEWFAYADARVGDDLRQWMGTLPHHLTFMLGNCRVRVVHGASSSVNKFMFASLPVQEFEHEMAMAGADLVIAGHSGIPFTRKVGKRIWHNSGSLGLPANDGTPRAWYSILSPQDDTISVRHFALAYDHMSAAQKMEREGVCVEYAKALLTGHWPSLDILPQAERDAAGQALSFEKAFEWDRSAALL